MLALLGFAMVATFMTLIMTRRAAPLVALAKFIGYRQN